MKNLWLFCTFFLVVFNSSLSYSAETDVVKAMVKSFDRLKSYKSVIYSKEKSDVTEIQYSYRKPGFIHMKFVSPRKGAELWYSPETKKAVVKPFKNLPLKVTLSPENKLIKKGDHTVDKSDLGSLIENIEKLASKGVVRSNSSDPFYLNAFIKGKKGFMVDGVNSYRVKVDRILMLPVKIISFDIKGMIIESVEMRNLIVKN